jgi:hypothetical protein
MEIGTPPTRTRLELTAAALIVDREHSEPTLAVALIRVVDVESVMTQQTPERDPAQILVRTGDVAEGLHRTGLGLDP